MHCAVELRPLLCRGGGWMSYRIGPGIDGRVLEPPTPTSLMRSTTRPGAVCQVRPAVVPGRTPFSRGFSLDGEHRIVDDLADGGPGSVPSVCHLASASQKTLSVRYCPVLRVRVLRLQRLELLLNESECISGR